MKKILCVFALIMLCTSSLFAQLRAVNNRIDFGLVEIDQSGDQVIVLENGGAAPLLIGTPRFVSNDQDFFTLISNGCTTLTTGTKCSITVRCQPKIAGKFSAALRIPVETPGFSNITVNLSALGVGVLNIGSDTTETIRVWQKHSFSFLVRKNGAVSYDFRINSNFNVQQTTFNVLNGEFTYSPDETQRRPFTITFMAKNAVGDIITEQTVDFEPIPGINPEEVPAGLVSQASVPDSVSRDYTVIESVADATTTDTLNYASGKYRTVTLIGKTLEFSDNSRGKNIDLNQFLRATDTTSTVPLDLKELNLIAETIIIRDSLLLHQTNVNIIAKELRFVDENGNRACLTTQPKQSPTPATSGQDGVPGLRAGDINLKINKFISLSENLSPRIISRFILSGGEGQNLQNTANAPGAGGNGGTLTVNKYSGDIGFLQQYFDAPGGLSGKKSNGERSEPSGNPGTFVARTNGKFDWFNPMWFRLSLIHLKDAYLYEKWDYVQNTIDEYSLSINDALNSTEMQSQKGMDSLDLAILRNETEEISTRINQNLDYFGNPFGWAPNLSFEYNTSLYTNELDYAIPAIAFIYKIQNRVNILEDSKSKLDSLIKFIGDRQDSLVAKFIRSNAQIEPLSNEIKAIDVETIDLQNALQKRAQELEANARNNTKRKGLKRVAQIGGALCRITSIATGNDFLRQVGNGLDALSNMSFKGNLIEQGQKSYDEYQSLEKEWKTNGENFEKSLPPEVRDQLNDPKKSDQYPSVIGAVTGVPIPNSKAVEAIKNSLTSLANLRSSLVKLNSSIRTGAAPAQVVQVELARLRASDPEFNDLIDRIEKLVIRRGELAAKLEQFIADLTFVINELPRVFLAASVVTSSRDQNIITLDPRVGTMMKDMEKSIRDRVLLYNYWMRKSYEYRFMEPYPYSANPWNTFDAVRKVMDTAKSPQTLISDFKTLFKEDLKRLAGKIASDYNTGNTKKQPAPGEYPLTKEQVKTLNSGKSLIINPFEVMPELRSLGDKATEDVRIVDVKFDLNIIPLDSTAETPRFRLQVNYPQNSIVANRGVDYRFIFSDASDKEWSGVKIGSNPIVYTTVSRSDSSLLRFLLGTNADIDFFARPGANAPLTFSASLATSDRRNAELDTTKRMVLRVEYEYRPQISSQRTAIITTNSTNLKPTIWVSADNKSFSDKKRTDGNGSITRTFTNGTNVQVEAVAGYGTWHFDHWVATDGITSINSPKNTEITLSMDKVRSVEAVYLGPINSLNLFGRDTLNTGNARKDTLKPNESLSLKARAGYLDGRNNIDVTANSSFEILDNNPNVEIVNANTVHFLSSGNNKLKKQAKVQVRYVENDIEMFDTLSIYLEFPNEVKDYQENSNFDMQIVPNPTNGNITLELLLKLTQRVQIEIINYTGQIVYNTDKGLLTEGIKNNFDIDCSSLSSGSYFIKVKGDSSCETKKFIIIK